MPTLLTTGNHLEPSEEHYIDTHKLSNLRPSGAIGPNQGALHSCPHFKQSGDVWSYPNSIAKIIVPKLPRSVLYTLCDPIRPYMTLYDLVLTFCEFSMTSIGPYMTIHDLI